LTETERVGWPLSARRIRTHSLILNGSSCTEGAAQSEGCGAGYGDAYVIASTAGDTQALDTLGRTVDFGFFGLRHVSDLNISVALGQLGMFFQF
jgi:hypothetical protein